MTECMEYDKWLENEEEFKNTEEWVDAIDEYNIAHGMF